MTYQDIATMIETMGYPYAYYQFPEKTEQSPPFICFLYGYDDVYADNSNYAGKVILYIEFYTDNKDIAGEYGIQAVLAENGLAYDKESTYIDSERMWQTTYSMEVFINE